MTERDQAMTQNVEWCHDHPPGNGVVVWTHDNHLQRDTFDDKTAEREATTIGEFLHRRFGDTSVPMGVDF